MDNFKKQKLKFYVSVSETFISTKQIKKRCRKKKKHVLTERQEMYALTGVEMMDQMEEWGDSFRSFQRILDRKTIHIIKVYATYRGENM